MPFEKSRQSNETRDLAEFRNTEIISAAGKGVCSHPQIRRLKTSPDLINNMASVYKSLSKDERKKEKRADDESPKNRQRVLILSSRGVTYRYSS